MNARVERVVLLVEDNPGDADLVREYLAPAGGHGGFRLEVVGRLDAAMAWLETATLDAVLLDLGLPDGHGLESVRALRARGDFPIVVLTGTNDDALALACVDAGADDYLCKSEIAGSVLRRALSYAVARRREQLLRERSRTLFETINLIVLELDREGRIDYVNGYFYRLTGWSRHETLYRDVFTFIPADQRRRAQELFAGLIENNLNPHVEVPFLTKSGAERMVVWHNTALRDVQGRTVGSLSIGEDITDRRLLESRLRQSQKMEGIGRLAGGVAHDFNNILTAIIGNAALLRHHLPDGGEAVSLLQEIEHAADRASSLTRQLLAFSRRQVLEPRAVSVNEIVAGLDRMLQRIIGEQIDMVASLSPEAGSVLVDPGQFEQVLVNLVVNARDAMPDGGKLTIETGTLRVDDEHGGSHPSLLPGDYAMVAVSDTGHGMDAAVQAQIFEPFFTTKVQGKGTGLGLATAYGIVRQSGGQITVYSEVGVGSSFKVYLPKVEAGAVAKPVRGAQEPEARPGHECVLLVEDDDSVRRLAGQILSGHGYTVHVARDGVEGLALAQQLGDALELVVSDVVMPNMGGREMVLRLRVTGCNAPVVFMSGYANDAIERNGALIDGAVFLQKPFSRDSLLRKVAETLDGAAAAPR